MTYQPKNFTVWIEIPVTDLEKSVAFYNSVTDAGLVIDESGPIPMAVFMPEDPRTGVAGNLYVGEPSKGGGPTIHLASPGKVEDIAKRVEMAGGKVMSPPVDIPEGRFVYCQDIDGNSISFFESKA